MGKTGQDY